MAGIQTSITLKDGVSPALRNMTAALNNLENVLNSVSKEFRNAYDADAVEVARKKVAGLAELTKKQENDINKITQQIAEKEHKRLEIADKIKQIKAQEFFKTSRISDLTARQKVLETGRDHILSLITQKKNDLAAKEQYINALLQSGEYTTRQLQYHQDRRNTLADEIAKKEARVLELGRKIKKNENDINTIKASRPATDMAVKGFEIDIDNIVADIAVLNDRIDAIINGAIADQEKLANAEAKRVLEALEGVRKVEAENIKAANAVGAANEKAFVTAMEGERKLIVQSERRAAREASLQANKQNKLQQEAAITNMVAATQERYATAIGRVNQKYDEAKQKVIQLERSVDRTNQLEMKQLKSARDICSQRQKIVDLTNKLVQTTIKLNTLEIQGKNNGLQALIVRKREHSIKRDIANAARTILNIERQIKTATDQTTQAQKRHNEAMREGASNSGSNALWGKMKGLAGAYVGVQSVGSLIKTADALAANEARLKLMVKEGESVEQISNQIYEAAMRSRSGYMDMADAVSKVGIQAGNLFSNSGDMVRFMETFNKMAVISKSTTQQTKAAMTQLIQALSFGQLRGDELKSILENMPMVAHVIADELERVGYAAGDLPKKLRHIAADGKVTEDEIRAIGYEGEIASNTVVNAMLNGAKKIDKMAKDMTWTWGQVWEVFKNAALKAFTPVFNGISRIIQTSRFKRFATWVGDALNKVARFITEMWSICAPVFNAIFDAVANIGNFITSNWSFIAPIVWGIVSAFVAYKGVLAAVWFWTKAVALWDGIMAGAKAISTVATMLLGKATWGETNAKLADQAATYGLTTAQWSLNAAMYACPLTWIILLIIAVIAVIYLVVAAINKVCDTSISATGIIAGAVMWLGAVIYDILAFVWNAVLATLDGMLNPIIAVCEWIYNAFNDGFTGWIDGVKNAFWTFVNWALQVIKPLISVWDKIKGTNYASSLQSTVDSKIAATKTSNYKKFDRNVLSSKLSLGYFNPSDAYNKGYDWGSNVSNKFDDLMSGKGLEGLLNPTAGKTNDLIKALNGGFDDQKAKNPALDKIANNTDGIKDNTGATAENTASSDEEFKYMRRLAEREAMNRYQLTDLKVEMTNNNSISSNVDANEVMRGIVKQITNAAKTNAESAFSFVF